MQFNLWLLADRSDCRIEIQTNHPTGPRPVRNRPTGRPIHRALGSNPDFARMLLFKRKHVLHPRDLRRIKYLLSLVCEWCSLREGSGDINLGRST